MSVLRSMKDLWVLISGTSLLQSKEIVGTELEGNSSRILNGVSFYEKKLPTPESKAQVEKLVTDKYQLQFIEKICSLLKISELQCYDLFCSYLLYEYKGTKDNLHQTLKSERHIQVLLQEVWNYYYVERFYALLCMKQVLYHWQDENHPFHELYEGFLDSINIDGAVGNKAIAQLEEVNNAEIPNRESYGQCYNDKVLYRWVIYNLKEQLELLQILLLFFKDMESTSDNLKTLFAIFQKHSFGQKLLYRQYVNDAIQHLVDTIGFMEGILFVECLELELLQTSMDIDSEEHYLLKDLHAFQSLDRVICCLGNHQQHAIILLSWMLLRHSSKDNTIHERSVIVQLGNSALKLKVFQYMAKSLSLPLVSGEGMIPNLMNTVVYSLMSILLSTFEIGTLGTVEDINAVTEKVLCYPNTANDFWKKGLDEGLGQLLNTSLSLFPVEMSSTLRILTALAKSGPESCQKVFELMKNVPFYCEAVNEFTEFINIHDQWQLMRDKHPYMSDLVVIHRGTIGELISNVDKCGRPLVRWHQVVNGWQICLLETQILLNRVTARSDCLTPDFVGCIRDLAQLVNQIIRMYPSAMNQLEDLFQILLSTLTKLSLLPQPPMKLLASILDAISAAAKQNHPELWRHMLNNNFLPFLTGSTDSIAQLASGVHCDIGLVGRQVASQEQTSGSYDFLLSFLDLLDTKEFLKDDKTAFLPCLVFIFRDIFPNHHKWRYIQQGVREKIGVKCLNIFHNLLQLADWENQKKLNKSQELCVYSLLHTEASKSLLRIVATGEHVIRSAMEQQGSQSQGLGQQLTTLVQLSLSVLNRLLLLRKSVPSSNVFSSTNPISQLSILEQSLLALPSQPNQSHLILGVAYYAFQRYDPRMATLSVQLLRRCAQDYPMSLLACLGSEATAVRDLFLLRLKSPSEDVRLKVAIIRFLTACVKKQPGLLEMFVNVRVNQIEGQVSNNSNDENCLQCAIQILKHKKKGAGYCPRDLHCAVVEFLHSLWAAHHLLAIQELKKEPQLWPLLCDPLLKEDHLDSIDCRVIAFLLHTLALQGFHRNVFGEGQMDSGVKAVFKEIEDKKKLITWSKHIRTILPSTFDLELSRQQLECSLFSDQTRDTFLLLLSWRDFLLIVAKENLMNIPIENKETLLKDILTTLQSEMDSTANQNLLSLLAELYLLLSKSWETNIAWDNWFGEFGILLDKAASNASELHPKMLTCIISVAINSLKHVSTTEGFDRSILNNWASSVCLLVQNLSRACYTSIKENDQQILQLNSLAILLMKDLIDNLENDGFYKPLLNKYCIIDILINLLIGTLQHHKGVQLAHTICLFILSISENPQMAEILRTTGLLPQTTLLLLNTYEGKEPDTISKGHETVTWLDIFGLSLQITANLLKSLSHFGLNDTFNFMGVHLDQIVLIMQRVSTMPHTKAVFYATQACSLILALSTHQHEWRLQHVISHQLLLSSVCNASVSVVAYLLRPNLLEHLVQQQKPTALQKSNFSDIADIGSTPRQFSSGSDQWEKASAELIDVQNRLLEFLGSALATLKHFSPTLQDILSDQSRDASQWSLLLDVSFSTPSVEHENPLNFGTILACIHFCLQAKVKNNLQRQMFSYILENSLIILLSQAALCQISPNFSQRDQQLMRRELNAELSSLSLVINRAIRRDSSPASPHTSETVAKSTVLMNRNFLKFVTYLVEKLFK